MKNLTKKVMMVIFCAVLLGTVCGCGNDEYEKRIAELEKQLEESKKPEEIKLDYETIPGYEGYYLTNDIANGRNVIGKTAAIRLKRVRPYKSDNIVPGWFSYVDDSDRRGHVTYICDGLKINDDEVVLIQIDDIVNKNDGYSYYVYFKVIEQ